MTNDQYETTILEIIDAACSCMEEEHSQPIPSLWAETARLMRAAPKLLEACRLATNALKDHLQYDNGESLEREAYDALIAAIAEAEDTP